MGSTVRRIGAAVKSVPGARRLYVSAYRAAQRTIEIGRLAGAKVGRWKVECPICGWRFREFLRHGSAKRRNARCPRCHSLERHRLLYLYLSRRSGFFRDRLRVLHFAPERAFRALASRPNLDIVTADLALRRVDVSLDIARLPFQEDSFDVVLCNHVLEHVADDRSAMSEIHRVLRPGGWAVLMVPLDGSRATTIEDPTVTDPVERERLFGQHDHVRAYGWDYSDRLRGSGFEVTEDWVVREVDAWRYGLVDRPVHVCVKPARGAPPARSLAGGAVG